MMLCSDFGFVLNQKNIQLLQRDENDTELFDTPFVYDFNGHERVL